MLITAQHQQIIEVILAHNALILIDISQQKCEFFWIDEETANDSQYFVNIL